MSLTNKAAAAREVMIHSNLTRSSAMNLLHQELARAQLAWRHQEAQEARRSAAVVDHHRWQRRSDRAASRAQQAAQRAQLVLAAR
jgi:hypothetical protein